MPNLTLALTLTPTYPNTNPKNNRNLCGRVPEIHSNIPPPSVDYSFLIFNAMIFFYL